MNVLTAPMLNTFVNWRLAPEPSVLVKMISDRKEDLDTWTAQAIGLRERILRDEAEVAVQIQLMATASMSDFPMAEMAFKSAKAMLGLRRAQLSAVESRIDRTRSWLKAAERLTV